MKKDIILAGVGGQGILSIATIIGAAAVELGMHLKQAEVHGMSQRGGDVQSHLRISDNPIASDLIPQGKADLVISIEPMEALRYLPWLSNDGWVITNTEPFINVPNYPEKETVLAEVKKIKQHVMLDAEKIAKDLGNIKVANVVILGAASPYLGIAFDKLETAIREMFGRKGDDVVNLNLEALRAGAKIAKELN
ncbi:MAG: indolepyruvate oxidoreductase subunit beta [Bacteroidales bacterium]|nr:indolepyruvate oxidoreductase subunit beta [Bacteroidales bacterium]